MEVITFVIRHVDFIFCKDDFDRRLRKNSCSDYVFHFESFVGEATPSTLFSWSGFEWIISENSGITTTVNRGISRHSQRNKRMLRSEIRHCWSKYLTSLPITKRRMISRLSMIVVTQYAAQLAGDADESRVACTLGSRIAAMLASHLPQNRRT